MTRTAAGVDRLLVLIVGAALIFLGAGAAAWERDLLTFMPDQLRAGWTNDLPDQGWWPAALMAAGVVLALLALRWLVAHLPNNRVRQIRLDGSGDAGRLSADLTAVAAAAAVSLTGDPAIRSASGRAIDDRGRRTIEIVAHMASGARLTHVAAACDTVRQQLADVAGPATAVRIRVRAGRGLLAGRLT